MMMIVAIAVDQTRELHFMNAVRRHVALLPVSLAGFLVVFATSYWGLHAAMYGLQGAPAPAQPMSTHSADPERPHAAEE